MGEVLRAIFVISFPILLGYGGLVLTGDGAAAIAAALLGAFVAMAAVHGWDRMEGGNT